MFAGTATFHDPALTARFGTLEIAVRPVAEPGFWRIAVRGHDVRVRVCSTFRAGQCVAQANADAFTVPIDGMHHAHFPPGAITLCP